MVMVTAEARVMAAGAMAAANATATVAMTEVVVVLVMARNVCVEGNCVGDAAVAAVTAASTMAVKVAAR